jgi:hypothetical protein
MGGGISVKSELGRGSIFTIRIPATAAAEPAGASETPDRAEIWGNTPSVLALAS